MKSLWKHKEGEEDVQLFDDVIIADARTRKVSFEFGQLAPTSNEKTYFLITPGDFGYQNGYSYYILRGNQKYLIDLMENLSTKQENGSYAIECTVTKMA